MKSHVRTAFAGGCVLLIGLGTLGTLASLGALGLYDALSGTRVGTRVFSFSHVAQDRPGAEPETGSDAAGIVIWTDSDEEVGAVMDVVLAPDGTVSHLIVDAGDFVGMHNHAVVVPVAQLRIESGRIVMVGATRESLRAMPRVPILIRAAKRNHFVTAPRDLLPRTVPGPDRARAS